MNTRTLIIYDDGRGRFGPATDLRAVFQLRTGALQTKDRIEGALDGPAGGLWVPKRLIGVVREACPGIDVNPSASGSGTCLLVNGRWAGLRFTDQVKALKTDQALVQSDGQTVAVLLDERDADGFIKNKFNSLPDHVTTIRLRERALLNRPWHVLDELPDNLLADLDAHTAPLLIADRHPQVTVFGAHPVKVSQSARLMPTVVIDAEQGPVVIEPDAVINPFVVIQGPCYIGRGTTLMPHACVGSNSVVGPNCKVGGEVSTSILHGYCNKSHAGYLGDSLVGKWVNLGAGTTTSNLKNTYGQVRVQLDEQSTAEDTGRIFLGAIIGDHVRAAISTRLPTGAVIHTGCMLANDGWAPKLAEPFGFYAGSGRQPYDIDKLILTIEAAMVRRGEKLTDAGRELIRSIA